MKKISKRTLAQNPTASGQVAIQRATDVRRDQLKANLTRMLQQLNTILADNKKSNDQKIQEAGVLIGAFSKQIDTTFQQLQGPAVTVAPGARTAAKKLEIFVDSHDEEDMNDEFKYDTVVPAFWRRNLDYTG